MTAAPETLAGGQGAGHARPAPTEAPRRVETGTGAAGEARADWRYARCRNENPELFFPAGEGGQYAAQIAEAKAVCGGCSLRTRCFQRALDGNLHGIWGGTTTEEREATRRARAEAARATRAPSTATVVGMARRIQALACIGWSSTELAVIARGLGFYSSPTTIAQILNHVAGQRHTQSRIDIERLVTGLYNKLSGCHSSSGFAGQATGRAKREGWQPPSAWVGLDIDDADVNPGKAVAA